MSDFKVEFNSTSLQMLIKSIGGYRDWIDILKKVVATVGLRDVSDHFRNKTGPMGSWPARSRATQAKYQRIKEGKEDPPEGTQRGWFSPNNQLLVLSGALRQGFLPSNIRKSSDAVTLFNPVEYAGKHDRGEGVTQRQFMWLSNSAMDNIEKGFVFTVMK